MGDMKKNNLSDKVKERQLRREQTVHTENNTAAKIAGNSRSKNKTISARVNGDTYAAFKQICAGRGITANACLNMLITDYVRKNKSVIEELL